MRTSYLKVDRNMNESSRIRFVNNLGCSMGNVVGFNLAMGNALYFYNEIWLIARNLHREVMQKRMLPPIVHLGIMQQFCSTESGRAQQVSRA